MLTTEPRWMRGDYFLLDAVAYDPGSNEVRVRFRNGDSVTAPVRDLWATRPGRADWSQVHVDPDTRGALLVPTLSGHPTLEGEIAEIPGDVIRRATDLDYRAYVDGLQMR